MPIRITDNTPHASGGISNGTAATLADECFGAMARHAQQQKLTGKRPLESLADGGTLANAQAADANYRDPASLEGNADYAWGAADASTAIFGFSRDAKVRARNRKRVFNMYAWYKAAFNDALKKGGPLPPNPGWVILPGCSRIILSKRAHVAFRAAQLGGVR
jgi:hypothetical protein